MRLDTDEEAIGTLAVAPATTPRTAGPRAWLVVAGAVAALIGLGMVAGGAGLVVTDLTARDAGGFVNTGSRTYATSTYAMTPR